MRRVHLFEFGDWKRFPHALRDAETAYLAVAYRVVPLPKRWAEKIAGVLPAGKPVEILDLCSGAGGPMPMILDELEARGFDARAKLTDLYPNPRSISDPRISYVPESVDAADVPSAFNGVRTMFTAFHHFRPAAARAVLKDAFDRRRAICIFEAGSGTALGVASMILVPVNVLLMMPFARPFRWTHLLFTYLIPLLPLIVFWDGFVSMLRVYSPEQMKEFTTDLQARDYAWEIDAMPVRGIPGGLPYLIGRPLSIPDRQVFNLNLSLRRADRFVGYPQKRPDP